jgi:hypothetical protein
MRAGRWKRWVIVLETAVTPVTVVGMVCRLPGGIESPEAPWPAVLRGDDLVTEVPAGRWDADGHYDPEHGVPRSFRVAVGCGPGRHRRLRSRAPVVAGDRVFGPLSHFRAEPLCSRDRFI